MPETLILALGNPLRGDDGVGAAVLKTLPSSLPNVVVVDGGTPGLDLVLTLQKYLRVIIIDAADWGAAPGNWCVFSEAQISSNETQLYGLHAAGLAEALALGKALNILPPDVTIFGIQPGALDWTPDLTPAVMQAIPEVRAAILTRLESSIP